MAEAGDLAGDAAVVGGEDEGDERGEGGVDEGDADGGFEAVTVGGCAFGEDVAAVLLLDRVDGCGLGGGNGDLEDFLLDFDGERGKGGHGGCYDII